MECTFKLGSRTQNKKGVQFSVGKSDKQVNIVFNSAQIHLVGEGVLASQRSKTILEMLVKCYDDYVTKHESIMEWLVLVAQDED